MPIAANTVVVAKTHPNRTYWCKPFSSADVTANETILAKPTTGSLYLEAISFMVDVASAGDTVTINDDNTAILGPIAFNIEGAYSKRFLRELKLSGALKIDQSALAPISGVAEGYTV